MTARGGSAASRQTHVSHAEDDDAPMTPPDVDRDSSAWSPPTPPEIDAKDSDVDMDYDEVMESKRKYPVSIGRLLSPEGTIVLDIGSHSCRIGSIHHPEPQHVMFSSWGESGNEISYERRTLQYSFYKCGAGAGWDFAIDFNEYELDSLLKRCFQKCDVRGKKVILSESHLKNDGLRRYIIRSLFETYQASDICIQKTPVLQCFALKKSSGIVVDVGASLTSVVPVINGVLLEKAAQHSPVAGNALDIALAQCLTSEASSKISSRLDVQAMKEMYCCCPGQPQHQLHNLKKGGALTSPADLSNVPMLLLPALLNCIEECTRCVRALSLPQQQLECTIPEYLPVLLVGGSSRFQYFKDAVVRGCGDTLHPGGIHIGQSPHSIESSSSSNGQVDSVLVSPPGSCPHTAWTGGRLLASGAFQLPWLSSSEYKERGIDAAVSFFG